MKPIASTITANNDAKELTIIEHYRLRLWFKRPKIRVTVVSAYHPNHSSAKAEVWSNSLLCWRDICFLTHEEMSTPPMMWQATRPTAQLAYIDIQALLERSRMFLAG